jgi:hypothetical protein
MIFVLYGALIIAPANDAAEVARVRALVAAWESGKDFVGLSEKEVLRKLGEPTAKREGAWEYWERLGPGFHSFQHVRVVRFDESGRVKTAAMEQRGVGCIIVEPREREK